MDKSEVNIIRTEGTACFQDSKEISSNRYGYGVCFNNKDVFYSFKKARKFLYKQSKNGGGIYVI